jgi:hypothetical protein
MLKWTVIVIMLLIPCYSKEHTPPINVTAIPTSNASFETTYSLIREWEGNYVNHPNDKGGKTYGGITKRYNPDWVGWKYIDNKSLQRHDKVEEAEHWVMDFYLTIWVKEGFYLLRDQTLANALFDLRVHTSKRSTINIINRTLNLMKLDNIIHMDGEWVAQLELIDKWYEYNLPPAYNDVNYDNVTDHFLLNLKQLRMNHYVNIVNRDSTQQVFMKGWMRRLNNTIPV